MLDQLTLGSARQPLATWHAAARASPYKQHKALELIVVVLVALLLHKHQRVFVLILLVLLLFLFTLLLLSFLLSPH